PITAEDKIKKKNDVKARSMLLMALPNEHLMTFNQYKDAKSLFVAIETRFGGFRRFTNSTNEVHTAYGVSTASTQTSTANLSDATVYAILANQSNGKKITINGSDTASFDKSKVECYNCHKMGHFVKECRGPRNQDSRNRYQDSSRRTVHVKETPSKAMVVILGVGFDQSYMAKDEVPTNMALMAFSDTEIYTNNTCSKTCLKSYETLKKQYDDLRIEFNKFDFNLATYERGLASVEEQLVFYKKNETDLSYSGLEEFKQPEFKRYGPKYCEIDSKNASEDILNELKEYLDAHG
nr:hypothetical protein [Tanacetum cinerariifolium]